MGAPKAALEWHGSTLLYRTTALLGRVLGGPVVVVAAPGQDLPDLPRDVAVAHDPVPGLGPLQGIAAGLTAVADAAETAFVCSTDLPFLHPAYVSAVLRELEGVDVALPHVQGHRQPLAAGYRTALGKTATTLLAEGGKRPGQLFERCRVRTLSDADLLADPAVRRLDPDLDSVLNINEPDAYTQARARPAPEITVERYGALARGVGTRAVTVRAATVGAAAAAVDLTLGLHVVAALNGDRISTDTRGPLVAGDVVAFLSADAGG
jgi:molybdopterin-guanine dinucleotide biosynthesis protein A